MSAFDTVGLAAIALVAASSHYRDAHGDLIGGANAAVIYVAWYLGSDTLYGVVAAVTFATILAVVAGMTLTAAAAVSHDSYRHALKPNEPSEER